MSWLPGRAQGVSHTAEYSRPRAWGFTDSSVGRLGALREEPLGGTGAEVGLASLELELPTGKVLAAGVGVPPSHSAIIPG